MDNVYGNSDIVFSHLEGKQAADFLKGLKMSPIGVQDIYANADEEESGGERNGPVAVQKIGAPYRCGLALLTVLCLALMGGIAALGVLYFQRSDRSEALAEENSRLSVSLSSLEQRLADFQRSDRSAALAEENSRLSVSLSSVEQRLAGTGRKLEELQLEHKNATEALSAFRDAQKNFEELQVKHSDLLKTVSRYSAIDECTCHAGWRAHEGKCYFLSTEKMHWLQSEALCVSKGAHLLIINNQEEQSFVTSVIRETHWIGLSDREVEGQWVWVDGMPLDRSGIQHWWGSEPDNWMGARDPAGEDCAALGDGNGNLAHWFDAPCGARKKFVCEAQPRV